MKSQVWWNVEYREPLLRDEWQFFIGYTTYRRAAKRAATIAASRFSRIQETRVVRVVGTDTTVVMEIKELGREAEVLKDKIIAGIS